MTVQVGLMATIHPRMSLLPHGKRCSKRRNTVIPDTFTNMRGNLLQVACPWSVFWIFNLVLIIAH